jgi:hypothetical protein
VNDVITVVNLTPPQVIDKGDVCANRPAAFFFVKNTCDESVSMSFQVWPAGLHLAGHSGVGLPFIWHHCFSPMLRELALTGLWGFHGCLLIGFRGLYLHVVPPLFFFFFFWAGWLFVGLILCVRASRVC